MLSQRPSKRRHRNLNEHCGESKAKPFKWAAEWAEVLTGKVQIQNPFTPIAARRGTSFEARPHVRSAFP